MSEIVMICLCGLDHIWASVMPKNNYKCLNLGFLMPSINCPECDADIALPTDSVAGEIVACPDCGQSYELYESEGSLSLKVAETIGEDWGE